MATAAPQRASWRQMARPIPREPPVTNATLSERSNIGRCAERGDPIDRLGRDIGIASLEHGGENARADLNEAGDAGVPHSLYRLVPEDGAEDLTFQICLDVC